MKIYLAGPMRGYPLYNFAEFFRVAIELRKLGHTVENPAEYDMAIGLNPALPLDDPMQIVFNMEAVLKQDFEKILANDAIVFLPGWEASTGALAERIVAHYSGRGVYLWLNEELTEGPYLKPFVSFNESNVHSNEVPFVNPADVVGVPE